MAATCMIYDQRLKGELQSLRRKGALCASVGSAVNGARTCSRCRDELGRIINRGACCPSCGQRVCKSCRQYGSSPTQWLCTVCHKQMELKTTTGEWMKDFIADERTINATETVKRCIQRSWTFSDVSPSPWSFLRGSPEMRAYSSMPRHQDVEYYHRPSPSVLPLRAEEVLSTTTVDPESDTTSELRSESIDEKSADHGQDSTENDDLKKEVVEPITGTIFRKVTLRVDAKNLPPGVTPPRSRRRLLNPDAKHEEDSEKLNDLDAYNLVYISDSSSREEISDDSSSTTSGLLDWDYFECWGGQRKSVEGVVEAEANRVSLSPAPVQCIRVPVPFPFPVPVPVFLPFPVAVEMSIPKSEILPRDEVLSHNAVSPLVDTEQDDTVVLKVYKNLDTTDDGPLSPECILRITEAKLKDFTEIGDSSVSSISSDEENENHVPTSRIYTLNQSEDSSGEFSLATPPASSDSDDSTSGKFSRTLHIQEPSDDEDQDTISSIITFSKEEVIQIINEFLEEERKFSEVKMKDVPETRSNTSDEFSGTESMEMPLEDSLECGEVGKKGESGRYTSLVMITQEQGPQEEVTSSCLEEGLADDDSWVEDLDRESDSSEEETYQDTRGYQRCAIDFTLHTIAEESCEESEVEVKPTELEKYFFFGLGDAEDHDTMSETSSIYSESVENVEETQDPAELASSRLEKYFLSGFMGFRRDSDGSVGSDSEGRPSPEQRRKRLVRARGTGRQHSSLDNLVESAEEVIEISGSSEDSHDEPIFDKIDGQFDTVKRTKKKKRLSTQAEISELAETPKEEETPQEPQPELLSSRNKQPSRDSGFVGSCDDLLKEPESKETPKIIENPLLIRKDSFNNWSSDEETNLMMSKMRAFFKTMVGNQPKGPDVKPKVKPPQLVYFESELTRLMKTVPGLKDEQVKEIVEYLSSEDTWSDSYDSSDYTSSDLENSKSALQEEISASCRQIISNFETTNDDFLPETNPTMVYQRLVASFNKIEAPKKEKESPVLIEKVMQHIGSRLWALMHEVSSGDTPRKYHKRLSAKLSASTTEEEEDVEDYSPLPRSKSHDPLLEENRQEASDNERFSWRGSFESALMAADSRTRLASGGESASASALALAAKRRSAGDLMFKSFSREQLDRVRSCGSIGGSVEDRIWTKEKRRRSSVPDSPGNSAGDDDSDEEPGSRATLPRSLQVSSSATNSLPRLPTSPTSAPIYKSHSVQFGVKSARYRPPGYRTALAPPPRRDRRRNITPCSTNGCDDSSICSEPVSSRGTDEEVDRLLSHRTLGARSDSLASVYSGAGEGRHGGVAVRGEVKFALQYNYKQSSLEIHVKQCKDLAPVDIKRNRSDPYVKVYLLPDKSKSGKRKTRVKKHTLNPVFDEVLRFQISLDELEHRTLWLSVWHSDMFGRNDFLGEVLMLLEKKVFDNPHPDTYQLQERSEPLEELNSKGELIVGLKYETPSENKSKKKPSKGCLYILVKEAKNLPPVKTNGSSDPFCKSYLLPDKGKGSKQKAPVIRKTCNPIWNHTFVYNNITLEELAERSLELTVWDHDRLASNEFLGGVRLNGGTGTHNEKDVDWMDSSGNEITLWQRMLEKPNFWVESCLPLRPSLDFRSNNL